MKVLTDDISSWASSLDDFKPEYTPIKVWNPIQFYTLSGRKLTILLDNFEPITDLHYALYSPKEERYYLKEFPNLPMGQMLFYKTDENWDSYDVILNSIRRYIDDKNIYLLLTAEQIKDTTEKLKRLYKANLQGEGKLDYKLYIEIVRESLAYEDYKDKLKGSTGYLTVCKGFEDRLAVLWKSAYKLK